MTVKELIEQLENVNPEALVFVGMLADPDAIPLGVLCPAYEKKKSEFVFLTEQNFTEMRDEKAIMLEGGEE